VFEGDAINLMDLVVFQSRLQQHGGEWPRSSPATAGTPLTGAAALSVTLTVVLLLVVFAVIEKAVIVNRMIETLQGRLRAVALPTWKNPRYRRYVRDLSSRCNYSGEVQVGTVN
jgi:hypothetical protein